MTSILWSCAFAFWILLPSLFVFLYKSPDHKTIREARALITILEKYAEDAESMRAHLNARALDMDKQVVELSNTARRLREATFAAKFD